MRLGMFVAELIPLFPRLVLDIMDVLDIGIAPHISMTKFERLERVVTVRQRHELVVKDLGEQVLVWEFVRLDARIGVQNVD